MATTGSLVLDVGNCDPDHAMIRRMLTDQFEVDLDRVMFVDQALDRMRQRRYDLVMFNRLIFEGGAEGIELLRRAKADPELSDVPIMMISNFEEAQQASIEAGGVPGFGKRSVNDPATHEMLAQYLPEKTHSVRNQTCGI